MSRLLGMTGLRATAHQPVWAKVRPSTGAGGMPGQIVFDIRRSDLAHALRRFSQRTGRTVGFPPYLDRRSYPQPACSRQISRLAFNLPAPTGALDLVDVTVESGNPALKPLRADRCDVAYGRAGGLEAGFAQRVTGLSGAPAGPGFLGNRVFTNGFRADNGSAIRVPLERMSRYRQVIAPAYDRGLVSGTTAPVWRSHIAEASRRDAVGRPLMCDPYQRSDANPVTLFTLGINSIVERADSSGPRFDEYYSDTRQTKSVSARIRRSIVGIKIRTKPK